MTWEIRQGDVLARLAEMADESVHCIVTSPPYWGLRDYGTAAWEGGDPECGHANVNDDRTERAAKNAVRDDENGQYAHPSGWDGGGRAAIVRRECRRCGARRIDQQLGLEPTPALYIEHMVAVCRELRRVLRRDGTLWLNMGDSYAGGGRGGNPEESAFRKQATNVGSLVAPSPIPPGLKPKDLIGMPWRLAFALQADGWWLRSEIIWAKPNPMPESVTDRPTKAHEQVFLLSKSAIYYYDSDAIGEAAQYGFSTEIGAKIWDRSGVPGKLGHTPGSRTIPGEGGSRNARSVWTIPTESFSGAHFATYPTELVRRCIAAGTSEHGVCGECGAPYARVVERSGVPHGLTGSAYPEGSTGKRLAMARDELRRNGNNHDNPFGARTTLGWRPTCAHPETSVVPATVLAPFSGAGTTVMVALRMGRRGLGIELNPEYVTMAERRILADHGAESFDGLRTNGHTPPVGVQGRMAGV